MTDDEKVMNFYISLLTYGGLLIVSLAPWVCVVFIIPGRLLAILNLLKEAKEERTKTDTP